MANNFTVLTVPPNATVDEKLDVVLSLLVKQSNTLSQCEEKITELQSTNKTLLSSIGTLNKEIYQLKNTVNRHEQLALGHTVRLFGLPMSEDEATATDGGKALMNRVYEKFVKPILAAAKNKEDIPKIPSITNSLEQCYRVGKATADKSRPPPVLIRLTSHSLKLAILRNKKTAMPQVADSDQRLGIKKYTILEDVTGDTFKMLKTLAADSRVAKVWTVEGNIRFTREGDKNFAVKRVKSIYDPVDKIVMS
jgi:hypothetical protein